MQNTSLLEHPLVDALERYLLRQSPESESEIVETHFIACESCVIRLERVELEIAAVKLALREFHLESVERSFAKQSARRNSWFSLPRLSFAGALAMVAIALSVVPGTLRRDNRAPVNIQLTAYRGLESRVLPKDRALHVTLNAIGLNGSLASVTLVDGNGNEVWKNAAAPIRNNIVAVNIPQIHSAGTHFFRLYAPGKTSDQLREFSVIIQ